MQITRLFIVLSSLFLSIELSAEAFVINDDEGRSVTFTKPAKRIISLSPHATELLFAAGATDQIIATVSFSDYPEQAKRIPRIGGHQKIDIETIIKLNPDIIIAWKSGSQDGQIAKLKELGFKIYYSEPRRFKDIANNIINLGKMLGTTVHATETANKFLKKLNDLKIKYKDRSIVSVFYQVWNEPLITINKDHIITSIIEFCGGRNIYADVASRAPRIGIESILSANPDAIIIGVSETKTNWNKQWYKWQGLDAVKNNHVFVVNADYMVRQGVRVLKGIETVCDDLNLVRASKKSAEN